MHGEDMHGTGGLHGRIGHAWQGACMVGACVAGMCMAGGV